MVINLNAPVTSGSTGVIGILFVISDGGRHIHEVVSENIPPGASGPAPTQTSADVWKVASGHDERSASGEARHVHSAKGASRGVAPHPPTARVPPSPRGRGEGQGEGRRSEANQVSRLEKRTVVARAR